MNKSSKQFEIKEPEVKSVDRFEVDMHVAVEAEPCSLPAELQCLHCCADDLSEMIDELGGHHWGEHIDKVTRIKDLMQNTHDRIRLLTAGWGGGSHDGIRT